MSDIQVIQKSQEIVQLERFLPIASKIDEVVKFVSENAGAVGFRKAFIQSSAITQISELLTSDYMKPIMGLQNTKLGFKTDSKTGYNEATVKMCVTEAILNGFEVVGNQFNIIGGNCYFTQEGYDYKLRCIEGLWKNITYKVVSVDRALKQAQVDVFFKWKKRGEQEQSQTVTFYVKVNEGMGHDAIVGKSERKAKKWLYEEITGNVLRDGDVESATEDISHEEIKTTSTANKNEENKENQKNPIVEDAIVVEEDVTEKVVESSNNNEISEEDQKKSDEYFAKANKVETLEKFLLNVKARHPNVKLDFYNKKMQELKNAKA